MAEGIFMGTLDGPLARVQWVACPLAGVGADRDRYTVEGQFENGGGYAKHSFDSQRNYVMAWEGDELDTLDIDEVIHYQDGEYGAGLVYLADPFWFGKNMFRRNWATPALLEIGYKNFGPGEPVANASGASGFNIPPISMSWDTSALEAGEAVRSHTLLIPGGYDLHLGFSGSVTGDGAVRVVPILSDYTEGAPVELTALSVTGSVRMNEVFTSGSYIAVRVFITSTVDVSAGSVTIAAMDAQLHPTGSTPAGSTHWAGYGVCGMRFTGSTVPYIQDRLNTMYRSTEATLREVEEWL